MYTIFIKIIGALKTQLDHSFYHFSMNTIVSKSLFFSYLDWINLTIAFAKSSK
jgi:hypothetical protein